jgi:hypothetical protein
LGLFHPTLGIAPVVHDPPAKKPPRNQPVNG